MRKTIGWILIVCGVLAFIGGLTSKVEHDPLVSIMTFIVKIGMVVGGISLINYRKKEIKQEERNINQFHFDTSISKPKEVNIIEKKLPFVLKNIEGYNELPDEVKGMNRIGYFKKLYEDTKDDPATNPQMLIRAKKFFIPDNISFFKFVINQQFGSIDSDTDYDKFVSPSFKLFEDNPGLKSYIYPFWFYWSYPDVAMWLIKGEGNKIIKSEFMNKLDYLKDFSELDLFKEFMDKEFYKNQNSENEEMKIKPEHLRELIDLFKSHNPFMALECESEA